MKILRENLLKKINKNLIAKIPAIKDVAKPIINIVMS